MTPTQSFRRSASAAFILSLCCSACSPKSSPESKTTPPAAAQSAASDKPDAQLILGSWETVSVEKDGKADPEGAGGNVVFTKDTMNMGGIESWYRLNPDATPKQLDFNMKGFDTPMLGIYRLEGDMLSICFASTSGKPRPTVFETATDDENQLLVCRRASALPPAAADAEFDPSLRDAINEAIAMLESNQIEKYLERFAPPDELSSLKQSRWKETVEHLSSQRDPLLSTFRALLKMKPTLNQDRTDALFDLSQVHIEGGMPMPQIQFVKTGGKWYLVNR